MIPLQFYKHYILFEVEDAVTLDGGKTFLGVVQQFLDKALMKQKQILTQQSDHVIGKHHETVIFARVEWCTVEW